MGKISIVDSIVVKWQENKKQTIKNIKANQVVTVNIEEARELNQNEQPIVAPGAIFNDVTKSLSITYSHKNFDFIDFNIQSVLPHKFSEYSPALASADIDGNGLDDIVIGGNALNPAQIFLQQTNGSFVQKDLYNKGFGCWF